MEKETICGLCDGPLTNNHSHLITIAEIYPEKPYVSYQVIRWSEEKQEFVTLLNNCRDISEARKAFRELATVQ